MENNTGFTNKQKAVAVFKWTLKKYLPFSIAYWILLFISFPLVEIVSMIVCTSQDGFDEYIGDMKDIMPQIPSTGFTAVAIVFSTILAIMAFSYMHNKRSVDLFGSFPLSRRTLFFARYLAVIVSSALPILIMGIVGAFLGCSDDAMLTALRIIGILLLGVIGNISFVAFISLCCGTVADVIISYVVINIAYPVCVAICYLFPIQVIPGVPDNFLWETIFTMFCPVAAPFTAMFGDGVTFHIAWWLVLSIVLAAGCSILCKKRKAETAQNAFAFEAVEIVIKFISCFGAGFGFGWIMAYAGSNYKSIAAQFIWFTVGLIIGIMIANILLHLIFHRGLSKYVNSLMECGAVLVTAMIFFMIITTGAFGYDQRIPNEGSIKEIYVHTSEGEKFIVNGKNVLYKTSKDRNTIDIVRKFHKEIAENARKSRHHGFYSIIGDNDDYYNEYISSGMTITYILDNGKVIKRSYSKTYGNTKLPKEIENLLADDSTKLDSIPEKYINSLTITDLSDNAETYSSVTSIDVTKKNNTLNREAAFRIVEALREDIKQHGVFSSDEDQDNDTYTDSIMYSMDIYYSQNEKGRYNEVYCYFNIPYTYTNTIQALKDTGYINVQYYFYKDAYKLYDSMTNVRYENSDKTIYIKTPKKWSDKADIRCMLYDDNKEMILTDIDEKITKCEKVSEGLWKYTIPDVKSDDEMSDFDKIIIYQKTNDGFNTTGALKLPLDGNNYLTIGKIKTKRELIECGYMDAMYDYIWNEYKKNK